MDSYLVRAERLLAAKRFYGAALNMMDKIVALQKEHDLRLPEEFPFKYARGGVVGGVDRGGPGVGESVFGGGREGAGSSTVRRWSYWTRFSRFRLKLHRFRPRLKSTSGAG